MIELKVNSSAVIFLGRHGENEITEYVFDFSEWIDEFGNGSIYLMHQRSKDAAPYLAAIENVDDHRVKWTITNAETQFTGYGKAELIYEIDGKIAKSAIYRTFTDDALDVSENPPSVWQSYIDQIISETEKVTGMTAEAETLTAGSEATASYNDGILHLGIPRGQKGSKGDTGNAAYSYTDIGIGEIVIEEAN